MIHSFLLIGQSNMAGRGDLCDAPRGMNENIVILRNGRWQPLFRPVNPDRPRAGYCLAESFAEDYAKAHPGVQVGLIPCADGGTSIDQWQKGGLLYDNAICSARLAMRTSTLAGALWHQGEADCEEALYPIYEEKLTALIESFRKDLRDENLVFVLGALGDFLRFCQLNASLVNYKKINEALKNVSRKGKNIGFAEAGGLDCRPDSLHFNTQSLIEFGHRYFSVFEKYEDKNRIFEEKPFEDGAVRRPMESL